MKKELRFPQFTTLRYIELKKSGLSMLQWHIAEFVMFMEMQFENKQVHGIQTAIAEFHGCNIKSVQRSIEVLLEKGFLKKTSRKHISTTHQWLNLITLPVEDNMTDQKDQYENPPADSKPRKEYEAKMGADDHANWLTFWELYKTINYRDRENACKVFAKHAKHFNEIMFGLNHYIADLTEKSWQEPKMASAWLNAKRWFDYEGKGEPKKISNGAAAALDPFESFRAKCSVLSDELFNSAQANNLTKMEEDGSWDTARFDEKELSIITAVGFANIMRNISDGGFVAHEIKPVWESVG